MKAMAEQFGVQFRYDGTMWPRLDGGQQPFDYRLSTSELIALDLQDGERQEQWSRVAESCNGLAMRADYCLQLRGRSEFISY